MSTIPDHTAVRTALWRALHLTVDAAPPVLADDVGLKLVAPPAGWQERGDMHPKAMAGYRASILARQRYIEDLVLAEAKRGTTQYVILGAGLDTFAQRRPPEAKALRIFEIDMPATQAWKEKRVTELGLPAPRFVPVDFERGESWKQKLLACGFEADRPTVFASTGVSMYLTKEANAATMREMASFAKGSVLALSFLLTLDLLDPVERPQHEMVYERARAAGTPFVSFFRPEEIVSLARASGFSKAEHVSRADLIARYFAGRTDGLVPASGEEILVATV